MPIVTLFTFNYFFIHRVYLTRGSSEVKGYFILKLSEKTIGKNQKIEMISKDTAIISATMQYKFNIISFVMSLGSLCKVIEPQWLKEQIVKISGEMQEIYNEVGEENESISSF